MAVSTATPAPSSAPTAPAPVTAPNATIANMRGGGGGIGGFFKNLGGTALNALSVPQAAAFTINTNLIKAFQNKPGISWKNLGGGFYDKYGGARTTLLPTLGIDPDSKLGKYAGLGIDLVADPMWAVSFVPGAGQAYATAKYGKALRAMGKLDDIEGGAQALAKLEKFGPVKSVGPFAKNYDRFNETKAFYDFDALAAGERMGSRIAGSGAGTRADKTELEKAFTALQKDALVRRIQAADQGYIPAITLGSKRLGSVAIPLKRNPVRVGKASRARGGAFTTTMLQASVSGLRNTAENLTGKTAHEIDAVYKRVDAGEKLSVTTDMAVGMAMLKRAKSAKEGEEAIEVLRKAGIWSDAAQKLMDEGVEQLRHQAQLLGRATAADTSAVLTKWLAGSGGKIGQRISEAAGARQALLARAKDQLANALTPKQKREMLYFRDKLDRMADQGLQNTPDYLRAEKRLANLVRIEKAAVEKYLRRTKQIGAREKGAIDKADNEAYGELKDALREIDPAIVNALGGRVDAATVHPAIIEQLRNIAGVKHHRRTEEVGKLVGMLDELDYIPTPARPLSEAASEGIKNAITEGRKAGRTLPSQLTSDTLHSADIGRFEDVYNQIDVVTRKNVIDQLMAATKAAGDDMPLEEAERIADELGKAFTFAENVVEWQPGIKHNLSPVLIDPEVRGRELMMAGNRAAHDYMIRKEIEEMILDLGLANRASVMAMHQDIKAALDNLTDGGMQITDEVRASVIAEDMLKQYNVSYDDAVGWLNLKPFAGKGPSFNTMLGWLKMWFTNMNPMHFFTNTWGSATNGAVEGGARQAGASLRASLPGGDYWKLASAMSENSPEFLAKTVNVGGNTYTYADLLFASRFAGLGLGHGQSAQEIEAMIHLLANTGKTKNPMVIWARFGHRMNMTREDADRLAAWVKFMQAGDNPIVAGARVIRSKFDYAALTHFEKVWMRNLMLFYTWFRKNMEFQAYGMMARPGMYNAFQNMERNRPKDPNEPAYLGKAFGVWLPLFGDKNITFANPMADVYKYDFTQEGLRRNVGASLNPLFLTPIEAGMNRRFFTGAEIDKYPLADQKVPNQILGRLPFIGGRARASAGANPEPGVDPMLDLVWDSFKGPIGGQAEKYLTPGENTEVPKYAPLMKQLTGLTVNTPEPKKWQRNKYYEILNRMADQSAMYRLQR